MKVVSWFLCLLILALSVAPCADSDALNISANQSQFANAANNHSKKVQDACSPFCVCNCCNTSAVTKQNVTTQINPLQTVVVYQELLPGVINTAPVCVWQPPRLG